MTQPDRKKIKLEDKELVKGAVLDYIIKDLRPISSIQGAGMQLLISKMTYIGKKYGYFTPEMIDQTKLLPSRQTVTVFFTRYELFYHY